MRVFVSHSSADEPLAGALVHLLRLSLGLTNNDIRCSSVDGYRLPAGVNTDATLRREVHDADVLVALLTPASLRSVYVQFELGARWGSEKYLVPLLASGLTTEALAGPLAGLNALNASVPDQVHQLVDEMAHALNSPRGAVGSYRPALEEVVSIASARGIDGPLDTAATSTGDGAPVESSEKSEDELFQEGFLDILKAAGSLARNEVAKLEDQYKIRVGRRPDDEVAAWLLAEIRSKAADLERHESRVVDDDSPVAIRYLYLIESMAAPWAGKSFAGAIEDIDLFVSMESDPAARHQYMIDRLKSIVENEYADLELGNE